MFCGSARHGAGVGGRVRCLEVVGCEWFGHKGIGMVLRC